MGMRENLSYFVLIEGGMGEIIEKKSRFIASIGKAESEEEAISFVEAVKKRYWDASHNCSAYIIGNKNPLCRCSDDGEPGGTAGRPMLEVLQKEAVCNIVAVVTRYFGGTLLGTGGLVRAYTRAVKEGLKQVVIGKMRYGHEIILGTDYNGVGRILYLLEQRKIKPLNSLYTDTVKLKLMIPEEETQEIKKVLTDAVNGKLIWEKVNELYYIDKKSESIL